MGVFHFKKFDVRNERAALKVGTDAVLLGALMTIRPSDRRMLDIGTGTGVIALMAAQRAEEIAMPCNLHIDAIDIDVPSIDEARRNFEDSPWAASLKAGLTPLQDFVPDAPYDSIFTNPPFYDNSLTNPDEREAKARHTESLTFADILSFGAEFLAPEGRLAMILPAEQETATRRLTASFGLELTRIVRIKSTPAKKARRVVMEFGRQSAGSRKVGLTASNCRIAVREESLTIQDSGLYTTEYQDLVRPFLTSVK